MRFLITGIEPENPKTQQNAGGRALLYLFSLLNFLEHECLIVPLNFEAAPGDVAIYPDCVTGNPLGAAKIVHYMLYFWTGERILPNECVICYHESYVSQVAEKYYGLTPEVITLPTIEAGLFYPEEKSIEAVLYSGKLTVTNRPEGDFVDLSKGNMGRAECAALLRKARNLYTMDHYTIMIAEAALCRCDPWLVNENGTVSRITTAPADFQGCIMDPHRDAALAQKLVGIVQRFFNLK